MALPRVYFDIVAGDQPLGRIVMEVKKRSLCLVAAGEWLMCRDSTGFWPICVGAWSERKAVPGCEAQNPACLLMVRLYPDAHS